MISAIFSDVLFQAGAAGAFVGIAVFPVFLKRYREAAADADDDLGGAEEEFVIEPVKAPKEPPAVEEARLTQASAKGAEHPAEETAALKPAAAPKAAPKNLTGETLSGGISPAIVYLQNLKTQIEHFETEIHELRAQVSKFANQHDE